MFQPLRILASLTFAFLSASQLQAAPASGEPSGACSKADAISAIRKVLFSAEDAHPISREQIRGLLSNILDSSDPKVLDAALRDFEEFRNATLSQRSQVLRKQDYQTDTYWPKRGVEYMFYVDQFGTNGKPGTFWDAAKMIPYLDDLGVEIVYPLPFLKSAGLDGGFDVINFFEVDPKLGGNKAFQHFAKVAKDHGMKIKMDLILNHVSEEHELAKAVAQGKTSVTIKKRTGIGPGSRGPPETEQVNPRELFYVYENRPEVIRRTPSPAGEVVTYRIKNENGKTEELSMRLIFPDISDNHFRELKLPDGKSLHVLHTFMPVQWDVNFGSRLALREAYAIMGHWANQGVDLFRLDAIPFLTKGQENAARTHDIVELMSLHLKSIAPSARLMVEACQPLDDIAKYFGKSESLQVNVPGFGEKVVKLPSEAQGGYQFTGMNMHWLSLVTGEKKHLEGLLRKLDDLGAPDEMVWTWFPRVHDETSLEMLDPVNRQILHEALTQEGRGLDFRNGGGVSGRHAPLLDNDPDRIRQSYAITMSMDGTPVIYYGDEIAAQNDLAFMKSQAKKRQQAFDEAGIRVQGSEDTRDFNRGIQKASVMSAASAGKATPLANETYQNTKKMISVRKSSPALREGKTHVIANDRPNILSYIRVHSGSGDQVLAVHNLKPETTRFTLDVKDWYKAYGAKFTFKDLLTGRKFPVQVKDGKVTFELERYDSLWLAVE